MKTIFKLFFLLCLTLIGISCNKEEIPVNPKKAILGKWELIKQGSSLERLFDVPPNGYTEFLKDKTYKFYDYKKRTYDYGDYTLNDSMLIYYYYAVGLNKVDTIPVRYYFSFKDSKTLILDIDALAIHDFFVYKKIK